MPTSQPLAELLGRHRSQVLATWTSDLRAIEGNRYASQPEEELGPRLERGLLAVVETLATGDGTAIDSHALALSRTCLRLGFQVWEVAQGVLLLKDAARPWLLEGLSGRPVELGRALHALDAALSLLLGRFCKAFCSALRCSVERLSALEERHRLARELHDSVSQSLYGVTMYAEASARLLAAGRVDKGISYLEEVPPCSTPVSPPWRHGPGCRRACRRRRWRACPGRSRPGCTASPARRSTTPCGTRGPATSRSSCPGRGRTWSWRSRTTGSASTPTRSA